MTRPLACNSMPISQRPAGNLWLTGRQFSAPIMTDQLRLPMRRDPSGCSNHEVTDSAASADKQARKSAIGNCQTEERERSGRLDRPAVALQLHLRDAVERHADFGEPRRD